MTRKRQAKSNSHFFMKLDIENAKRIFILGDAGRGKSTLAKKLAEKLDITAYSTDDFFWKKKFTEKQDVEKSITEIKHIYDKEKWIVEGTKQHLVEHGFAKADIIIYLAFPNIMSQWYALTKRYFSLPEERLSDLFILLRHVFYKRYSIGYKKGEPKLLDKLQPYKHRLMVLRSYKEIDALIEV